MTWITPEDRFCPLLIDIIKETNGVVTTIESLWKEAVEEDMGLFMWNYAKRKEDKNPVNPFTKLAGSFVGQWVKWYGWCDTGNLMARKNFEEMIDFSDDPNANKPYDVHYKRSGSSEVDSKWWNSYQPLSLHQFRPPAESIGLVEYVFLHPHMVAQEVKLHGRGQKIAGLQADYQEDDQEENIIGGCLSFVLSATAEWYKMPEHDKRLKRPTLLRRKHFGITDEPEKTIAGNICWPIQICWDSDTHGNLLPETLRMNNHTYHYELYDGFWVWNRSRNNLYIGDAGFSLSTPLEQTQIMNHVWKPTVGIVSEYVVDFIK